MFFFTCAQETHLADIQKEKEQLHAQLIAMREKITVQATDLLQYDKKVQAMTVDLNGLQSQLQANGNFQLFLPLVLNVSFTTGASYDSLTICFCLDKQRSTLQQQLVGLNHRLSLTEQQLEGVRREKAVLDERFDVLKQENKLVETQLAVRFLLFVDRDTDVGDLCFHLLSRMNRRKGWC